ncbi:RNA polymerase sigma factor, partial [Nanoarchaeota archaeon]
WLYRISRNISLDGIRKRTIINNAEVELFEDLHEASDHGRYNPLRRVLLEEEGARVHYCLSQLSAYHAQVLELREFQGLSYGEISDIIGKPKGTVMSRLFHARRNLAELVEQYEHDAFVFEEEGVEEGREDDVEEVREEDLAGAVEYELEPVQSPDNKQESTLFDIIDDILGKEGVMFLGHKEAQKNGLITELKSHYITVSYPQINRQYIEEYLEEKLGLEEEFFDYYVATRKLVGLVFDISRTHGPIHLSHAQIEDIDRADIYEAAGLIFEEMALWEYLIESWQYEKTGLNYMELAEKFDVSYSGVQSFFRRTRNNIAEVIQQQFISPTT